MKVMILRLERDGIAAQAEVSAILAEAGAGAPDPNYGCSEAPPRRGERGGAWTPALLLPEHLAPGGVSLPV